MMNDLNIKFHHILNNIDESIINFQINSTNDDINNLIQNVDAFINNLTMRNNNLKTIRDEKVVNMVIDINVNVVETKRKTLPNTKTKVIPMPMPKPKTLSNNKTKVTPMPQTPRPQKILPTKQENNVIIETNDRYAEYVLHALRSDGDDEHIIKELERNFNDLYAPRHMKTIAARIYKIKYKSDKDKTPYLHGFIRFSYNVEDSNHRMTPNIALKNNTIKSMHTGFKANRECEKMFITNCNGAKNVTYQKDVYEKYCVITGNHDDIDTFL
jgi:hypothetical protein